MKNTIKAAAILVAASTATTAFAQEDSAFGGPYVGVQISAANVQNRHTDVDYWYHGVRDARNEASAPLGGIRVGYDHVAGSLILGALGEVSFGKLNSVREITPVDEAYEIGTRIRTLGSLRAKLGVTSGKLALFATGGIAFSDATHIYNETDGTGEAYRENGRRNGYVLGAGAAYAVNSRSSFGVDFSRYNFGTRTHELREADGVGTDYFFSQKDRVQTLTFSYNVRF